MKLILLLSVLSVAVLRADVVTPASYTATPGEGTAQGGNYNYFDDTGSQLTDGVFGVNDWTANLGNGNAYEWVGWKVAEPTITFSFPAPVTITSVTIDFNHTTSAGIYLPPFVAIDGNNYTVGPNDIPNGTRGSLDFSLASPFTGTSLTISMIDRDATKWIFVDEISFAGTTAATPEPATWIGLLSGLFAVLLLQLRRSRRAAR